MNAQVVSLIQMLKAATPPDAPRLWQVSPVEARQLSARFFTPLNVGGPSVAETREITMPGRRGDLRARLYVPHGAAPVTDGVLHLHGGGFVIGSPDTHDRLTRELAQGTGLRVVSLDYGLAPEHPFPEGLDDCVDAARWLGEQGARLGIDPRRLVIAGDSAGANLAAATALRLRDEGRGPARTVMDWFHGHYRGGHVRAGDPYYAPLNADLSGFPPSILVCGTLDPLLSDSQLFAEALDKAGVPVELHVAEDGIHAFVQMPMLDMAADAMGKLCAFAKRGSS